MGNRASQTAWHDAEIKVQNQLRYHGIDSKRAKYDSPYDLQTAHGLRIEVKWSSFITKANGGQGWSINAHRHNILDESEVNWYTCVLGSDPINLFGKAVLTLVIPAPVKTKSIVISPRSLATRWARYVDDWHGLVEAEQAAGATA